jgi:hypothetical protein
MTLACSSTEKLDHANSGSTYSLYSCRICKRRRSGRIGSDAVGPGPRCRRSLHVCSRRTCRWPGLMCAAAARWAVRTHKPGQRPARAHLVVRDGARVGEVHDAGEAALGLRATARAGAAEARSAAHAAWLHGKTARPAAQLVRCAGHGTPCRSRAATFRQVSERARNRHVGVACCQGTCDYPGGQGPGLTISTDMGSSSGRTVMELGMLITWRRQRGRACGGRARWLTGAPARLCFRPGLDDQD